MIQNQAVFSLVVQSSSSLVHLYGLMCNRPHLSVTPTLYTKLVKTFSWTNVEPIQVMEQRSPRDYSYLQKPRKKQKMSVSVQFDVLPCPPGRRSSLVLELEHGDTVSDILQDCRYYEKSKRGAWQVAETWNTCSKNSLAIHHVIVLHACILEGRRLHVYIINIVLYKIPHRENPFPSR